MVALLVLPVCLMRSLHALRFTSVLSIIAIVRGSPFSPCCCFFLSRAWFLLKVSGIWLMKFMKFQFRSDFACIWQLLLTVAVTIRSIQGNPLLAPHEQAKLFASRSLSVCGCVFLFVSPCAFVCVWLSLVLVRACVCVS